jgi:hypothetical protein
MVQITVLNPANGRTKTISAEMESEILAVDEDALPDWHIRFSTTGKKVSGGAIGPILATGLAALADGATQHNGGGGSYADLTPLVEDYVRHIVEGDSEGEEMDLG